MLARPWLALLGSAFAVLAITSVAPARGAAQAPADIAQARDSFGRGVAALQAERWEEACSLLEQSVALVETAQARFNLALCSQRLGRLLEQSEHLRAFVRLAGPDVEPARLTQARETINALDWRIPRLTLRVVGLTQDVTIEVNGRVVPQAAWSTPRPLSPGLVTIHATSPLAQPFHQEIDLAESEAREVTIELVRRPGVVVEDDGRAAQVIRERVVVERDVDGGGDDGAGWGIGLTIGALVLGGAAVSIWYFGFESQTGPTPYPFETSGRPLDVTIETLRF